jgi:glutamyl-tRNA synthetase
LKSVLTLCQEKVRLLGELPVYVDYFFNEAFPVDAKAKTKIFRRGAPCERLRELAAALESVESFSEEKLEITVKCLAESNEVYTGDFIHPARLAISGTNAGPSFYGLLRVLGKRRSLSRIQSFIDRFEESES